MACDQCLAVYRQLVQDFDPMDILGMSSSAGGQLMLSTLLMARKEGLLMIAGHCLCVPGADLSGDGDSLVANWGRDLMPTAFLIGTVRQNYENKEVDVRDPLYSPVYAEYDKTFPPCVISVGTRDSLLSSGIRLYWKLREASVRVELLVGEGMWHGFIWEDMPEAVQMGAAVRFFEQLLMRQNSSEKVYYRIGCSVFQVQRRKLRKTFNEVRTSGEPLKYAGA